MLNNLIEQTVDPDGTGLNDVTTKYAYDQNANVWADLSSTGTLLARRIYGDGPDALIARIDSNGVAWYLTDMLGSVRDITDSSGSLLVHQDFNAWGQMTYQSGATYADRFGFTGRPLDSITGLQNNRARWYDSDISRWMTQDPLELAAGDSNVYRYISNRPTLATDPLGLDPQLSRPPYAGQGGTIVYSYNDGSYVTYQPGAPCQPGNWYYWAPGATTRPEHARPIQPVNSYDPLSPTAPQPQPARGGTRSYYPPPQQPQQGSGTGERPRQYNRPTPEWPDETTLRYYRQIAPTAWIWVGGPIVAEPGPYFGPRGLGYSDPGVSGGIIWRTGPRLPGESRPPGIFGWPFR